MSHLLQENKAVTKKEVRGLPTRENDKPTSWTPTAVTAQQLCLGKERNPRS